VEILVVVMVAVVEAAIVGDSFNFCCDYKLFLETFTIFKLIL
jgi:hypothetical protein